MPTGNDAAVKPAKSWPAPSGSSLQNTDNEKTQDPSLPAATVAANPRGMPRPRPRLPVQQPLRSTATAISSSAGNGPTVNPTQRIKYLRSRRGFIRHVNSEKIAARFSTDPAKNTTAYDNTVRLVRTFHDTYHSLVATEGKRAAHGKATEEARNLFFRQQFSYDGAPGLSHLYKWNTFNTGYNKLLSVVHAPDGPDYLTLTINHKQTRILSFLGELWDLATVPEVLPDGFLHSFAKRPDTPSVDKAWGALKRIDPSLNGYREVFNNLKKGADEDESDDDEVEDLHNTNGVAVEGRNDLETVDGWDILGTTEIGEALGRNTNCYHESTPTDMSTVRAQLELAFSNSPPSREAQCAVFSSSTNRRNDLPLASGAQPASSVPRLQDTSADAVVDSLRRELSPARLKDVTTKLVSHHAERFCEICTAKHVSFAQLAACPSTGTVNKACGFFKSTGNHDRRFFSTSVLYYDLIPIPFVREKDRALAAKHDATANERRVKEGRPLLVLDKNGVAQPPHCQTLPWCAESLRKVVAYVDLQKSALVLQDSPRALFDAAGNRVWSQRIATVQDWTEEVNRRPACISFDKSVTVHELYFEKEDRFGPLELWPHKRTSDFAFVGDHVAATNKLSPAKACDEEERNRLAHEEDLINIVGNAIDLERATNSTEELVDQYWRSTKDLIEDEESGYYTEQELTSAAKYICGAMEYAYALGTTRGSKGIDFDEVRYRLALRFILRHGDLNARAGFCSGPKIVQRFIKEHIADPVPIAGRVLHRIDSALRSSLSPSQGLLHKALNDPEFVAHYNLDPHSDNWSDPLVLLAALLRFPENCQDENENDGITQWVFHQGRMGKEACEDETSTVLASTKPLWRLEERSFCNQAWSIDTLGAEIHGFLWNRKSILEEKKNELKAWPQEKAAPHLKKIDNRLLSIYKLMNKYGFPATAPVKQSENNTLDVRYPPLAPIMDENTVEDDGAATPVQDHKKQPPGSRSYLPSILSTPLSFMRSSQKTKGAV